MAVETAFTTLAIGLNDVLGAVGEFGSASCGLVAWEFMVDEKLLAPLWHRAARQRLIEPEGHDLHTREVTYRLTPRGRELLSA